MNNNELLTDAENMLIINHIHPIKERLIKVEQTTIHHATEITNIHQLLNEVKVEVKEGNRLSRQGLDLSRKLLNAFVGGGFVLISMWSIIEFIIPLVRG